MGTAALNEVYCSKWYWINTVPTEWVSEDFGHIIKKFPAHYSLIKVEKWKVKNLPKDAEIFTCHSKVTKNR